MPQWAVAFLPLCNQSERFLCYTRTFNVYECVGCSDCPLREQCTKVKEGVPGRTATMRNGNNRKKIIKYLLSIEKAGAIYGKRKIGVELAFGFLKAYLCFTRFSVRGKEMVHNDLGFAFRVGSMRKYTDRNPSVGDKLCEDPKKRFPRPQSGDWNLFQSFELVMSQPHFRR